MSSLAKNYKRRKLSFASGKGSFLYTKSGAKYLDFVQGIAVNSLGHTNPTLVNAINKQSKKLWHVSNSFIIPEGEELARKLTKKTFDESVLGWPTFYSYNPNFVFSVNGTMYSIPDYNADSDLPDPGGPISKML